MTNKQLQEGDLVLGKVKEISNNVVFVTLEDGQKGTIISSEVAPGRIKNMRQYVVPNKQVVCKVLKISKDGTHIDLSLRRVTSKEKKEVLQETKQSHAIKIAFKQILKENYSKVEEKILKDFQNLIEFIDKSKEDEEILKEYIPKEGINQIKKLQEKRKKLVELNQKIKVKCLESDGIKKIKEVFSIKEEELKDKIKITYISAGNFKLKLTTDEFKQGKQQMQSIIDDIESRAKSNKCQIEFEEIKN